MQLSRKINILCFILSCMVFLTGCTTAETPSVSSPSSKNDMISSTVTSTQEQPPKVKTEEELRLERIIEDMKDMTLEQKVGQLFIVQPEALTQERGYVTKCSEDILENIKKYQPGGIILFGGNVVDPAQLSALTESFGMIEGIPLFISIDEEGGRVARIGQNENFDVHTYTSMENVGKSNDPIAAYEVGNTIGNYLNKYGFNLDFAPVADVNTNPKNRVIGNRAFGSDPLLVSDMVGSAIDGFHSQNIMTTLKHFPGHGDTKGDTHKDYVSVTKTWEELLSSELIPFISNLKKTDMIMAAHVTAVKVTSDNLPCSLSYEMLTGRLREELGYKGVIITDSLSMGAIKKNYTSAEASLTAFKAGADILLMPQDLEESYNAILNAVKSGEISEERLDQSVQRILVLKDKYL